MQGGLRDDHELFRQQFHVRLIDFDAQKMYTICYAKARVIGEFDASH